MDNFIINWFRKYPSSDFEENRIKINITIIFDLLIFLLNVNVCITMYDCDV